MDFFESQDAARRNTRLLLLLFLLAVASLVVLTNLLLFTFIGFRDAAGDYTWSSFAAVSAGVVLLVLLASLFRLASLRKGGSAIAELMDGELLIDPGDDLNRRKLLNVVEEMAIASGTPAPPVYLIRDSAINAFAAGHSPGDAVIGVTEGAMEKLSRNELQGVIAHEFSHILNGDMKLNVRLIGILYGILIVALIGRLLLHSSHGVAVSRNRSQAGLLALGAGLMIIGYLGQFFGNLIKAAVSRQREYLADAAAVQFTRDPQGIAGALKRIGGAGSVLQHPESAELSHTFFAQGVSLSFASLMATHPPLDNRIKRIEPDWDGQYPATMHADPATETTGGAMAFAGGPAPLDADKTIGSVGQASQPEVARRIIGALPAMYADAAREPWSARALAYLLLLDEDPDVRARQLDHLGNEADAGVYGAVTKLIDHGHELKPGMRLPLLTIALPTLRRLSYEQYKRFIGNVDALVRADGRIGLSEWAMQKMLDKHLGEAFEGRRSSPRYNKLEPLREHCEVLLSMLAYCDRHSGVAPEAAFDAGRQALAFEVTLLDRQALDFNRLNLALDTLADLHPPCKPRLLKACIRTISADQVVSEIESELLRTIADTLECPIPPLE